MIEVWERISRRARSELVKARKSVALVGLRRRSGPRTKTGASIRTTSATSEAVPVVICVWRRPERLRSTIESLAAQSGVPVHLWIWNNNAALRTFVDDAVAKARGLDVEVVHSSRNIGGFGRFYVARRLARDRRCVVFLDDDQLPADDFCETLLAEFTPGTVWSTWAFRFLETRSYWNRVAAMPAERVKFCATRGMVCDTRVFLKPGLFDCPRRFWFVEDLWLSYYADNIMGWRLFKSDANVSTDAAPHAQYHYLGATKDIMLRHLVRRGWDPVLREEESALVAGSHAQPSPG
jgi:hypothetical protein